MSIVNINYTDVFKTRTKIRNLCQNMSSGSLQDIQCMSWETANDFRSWNVLENIMTWVIAGYKPVNHTFVNARRQECRDELNHFKLLESLVFFTNHIHYVLVVPWSSHWFCIVKPHPGLISKVLGLKSLYSRGWQPMAYIFYWISLHAHWACGAIQLKKKKKNCICFF